MNVEEIVDKWTRSKRYRARTKNGQISKEREEGFGGSIEKISLLKGRASRGRKTEQMVWKTMRSERGSAITPASSQQRVRREALQVGICRVLP